MKYYMDKNMIDKKMGRERERIEEGGKTYVVRNNQWSYRGNIHREHGPAIVDKQGTKEWYIGGLLHRDDGPARECSNGNKEWWVNGQRHREDGPAIVWGRKPRGRAKEEFYYKGKDITPEGCDESNPKHMREEIGELLAVQENVGDYLQDMVRRRLELFREGLVRVESEIGIALGTCWEVANDENYKSIGMISKFGYVEEEGEEVFTENMVDFDGGEYYFGVSYLGLEEYRKYSLEDRQITHEEFKKFSIIASLKGGVK